MTWTMLWMKLFGSVSFWGINMGFWVGMAVVLLIVVLMNVVFWKMKPETPDQTPQISPGEAGSDA